MKMDELFDRQLNLLDSFISLSKMERRSHWKSRHQGLKSFRSRYNALQILATYSSVFKLSTPNETWCRLCKIRRAWPGLVILCC